IRRESLSTRPLPDPAVSRVSTTSARTNRRNRFKYSPTSLFRCSSLVLPGQIKRIRISGSDFGQRSSVVRITEDGLLPLFLVLSGQPLVKILATDSEDPRGLSLVAFGRRQRLTNIFTLHFSQRRPPVPPFFSRGRVSNALWQVLHFDL